jgi:hypothetical protein
MQSEGFSRGPELVVFAPTVEIRTAPSETPQGRFAQHVKHQFIVQDDFSEEQSQNVLIETNGKVASKFGDYLRGELGPATPGNHIAGIAIGSVQSGKTISFTAAIALGFDAGAAAAIVISGNDSALRDQTLDRLRDYFGDVADVTETLDGSSQYSDSSREEIVRKILDGRRKTVIVAMKEDDHLREVERILSAVSFRLDDVSPPKVIVIDDEGDQGSLNGLAGLIRKGVNKSTALHSSIARICQSRCVAAYVAYTATAFANALTDQDTPVYPTGFVSVLDAGPGYLGLQDLFLSPTFSANVTTYPRGFGEYIDAAIWAAVDHFLLVTEVRSRIRSGLNCGDLPAIPDGCLVMGVNAGHKNSTHEKAIKLIKERLEAWQEDKLDASILEAVALSIDDSLNSPVIDVARDYRNWASDRAMQLSGQIVQLNQFGSVKLRNFKSIPDRIIVGGQLLGRGFTLPRMISYVLAPSQDSANMDILQQRARFLGYRKSYAKWIRIWMDSDAQASFQKLATAEVHFRYQARVLEDNGLGLDGLDSFIILAGKHKPTSLGKIAHGHKERSTWWVSGRGSSVTPPMIEQMAAKVLQDGKPMKRGAIGLEISAAEARSLVDLFVEYAPSDAARLKGGLELSIGPKRDPDTDARATLLVMSQWDEGRERSRDEYGAVQQLFSGRGSDIVSEPSESQVYDSSTALTIQLHRLKQGKELGVGMAIRPINVPNKMLWILD